MVNRNKTISVLLVLCALGAQAKDEKKGPAPPRMPPPLVVVEKVEMIKESAPREYIGNVEAIEEVDLQPRISGFITSINFQQGGGVQKGDLLIEIEDTTYKAKTMAAKAALTQAEAELAYAESHYQRQDLLAGKEAVSHSTLEDAERLLKLHEAKCAQRKAELMDAENELGYTRITAPISGRIGQIRETRGNYVSLTHRPLAKIVSFDPIQVKFSISERIYQDMFKTYKERNGRLDVTIQLANGDVYPHKGRIAFADNVVDDNTGTISVWVEFDNPEWDLIPGGYVSALVAEKREKPLPGVKASAILTDNRGNFVYVLGPNNVSERRGVTLGEMVGNRYTIIDGLRAGETVVVDGTHKVVPGMPVNPAPSPGAKGKNKVKTTTNAKAKTKANERNRTEAKTRTEAKVKTDAKGTTK